MAEKSPDEHSDRLIINQSMVAVSKIENQTQSIKHDINKQGGIMKILALNSSPRSDGQSMTKLMLNHLTDGMRTAKADVEIVDLRKVTIKNCIGCFSCWTKTPGVCIHKDDMSNALYPKWLESDLVVYATPLYHYTVNASLKAFIERTLPILEPFFQFPFDRLFPIRF